MNWKRGLVRLWAVASVIWLLFWGTLLVMYALQVRGGSDRPPTQSEIDTCMAKSPGQWCNDPFVVDTLRWPSPPEIAIGLVPPIIAYAFGAALFWAFSGFRRRPDAG